MKNNEASNIKIKITIISCILILIVLASCIFILEQRKGVSGHIATIYVGGAVYEQIDLSLASDRQIEIKSDDGGINVIEIKNGDIHMLSANCKDELCVKQGYGSQSLVPIVCLPNGIVIKLENKEMNSEESDIDAITY